MGCNLEAGAGSVCENLKTALEKEGINVTVLDNVLYNAESMEKVEAMTGVVLVEKPVLLCTMKSQMNWHY